MGRILCSSPEKTGECSSRLLVTGTYADVTEDISTYPLKYAYVIGVHEDEQITYEAKRTVAAMLRDGIPCTSGRRDLSPLWHSSGVR